MDGLIKAKLKEVYNMAIILLVSAYMCADIVSILCDKKEENK
jgi:hypothetical protein|nr:MAG TPA: hypothetical protein [Caudoviricetes sp.]